MVKPWLSGAFNRGLPRSRTSAANHTRSDELRICASNGTGGASITSAGGVLSPVLGEIWQAT